MVDTLYGYAVDLVLRGVPVKGLLDPWSFSFTFPEEALRDEVLTHLRGVPDDAFALRA